MNPLVIGLTGGIGSGKSTVADLFATRGITVIDTDQLARDVTAAGQPALAALEAYFGNEIMLPNQQLNRSLLREIIFKYPEKRIWLEKLLHPLIRTAMKQQITEATSPYCIVVIPLLFESQPNPLIERILVVDTLESEQLKRAQARDNSRLETLEAIIKTQISRAERLLGADDVIENTGSFEDLAIQVDKLHEQYLLLARS